MLGLFEISSIEDYYEVDSLVAVSTDRAKLDKYISDQTNEFHLYKSVYEKYGAVLASLPGFDETPPVKEKLGFIPKTGAEHKVAKDKAVAYKEALAAWTKRKYEYSARQSDEAYELTCQQLRLKVGEVEKSGIMGYHHYYKPPEFEIREVECW